jgi:ferredoxin
MAALFTLRNMLRLFILAVFSCLALGAVPEAWGPWRVLLPGLSPLLNLGGAAATFAVCLLTPLALPLLILPLFKGRFFCWRLCPVGFVAETASRLNARNAGLIRRVPFLGKGLALLLLGSAAAGYPVLLWTDPLCIFNGFFAAWRAPLTWTSAAAGSGLVLILLASLIAPNIWCHRLCPLGGLEEWLALLANRLRASRPAAQAAAAAADRVRVGRRVFLGFAAGGAAGLATGTWKSAAAQAAAFIRPPGSADRKFNALCARCGNCMKACPYGLIVPDLGASGLDGLLTPVLKFRSRNERQEQFCFQDCTACTQVCPTGAIRLLSKPEKQQTAIGLARVDKKTCIAWEKGEYCVVCQEFCPYQAIVEVKQKGVNCPIVDEAVCRGCGACESQCPAKPIAIVAREIDRGTVEASIANTRAGTVEACQRTKLSTIIGGRIEVLDVKEGDRVKKGQLLMKLWNDDQQAQSALALTQVATARQRVAEACAQAANAERDTANANLETANARIAELESKVPGASPANHGGKKEVVETPTSEDEMAKLDKMSITERMEYLKTLEQK